MFPKFRAWLIKEKKMVEVKSIHLSTNKIMYSYSINSQSYGNKSSKFDEIELMQFINLKDKNSKDIYIGDILLIKVFNPNHWEKDIKKAIVVAENECVACVYASEDGFKRYSSIGKDAEIIGNIYENLELLEGLKEVL